MVLRRLLALGFALIVVVGAFAFRTWRDSGGSLGLSTPDLPIVCDAAIADACREAFGTIQSQAPGATYEQMLADPNGSSFVWITADIWIDMIDDERSRGEVTPTLGEGRVQVAHSPLVFAGPGIADCDPPNYICLAGNDLDADVGIEDRFDTSAGLVAFGQLAYERNGQSNTDLHWRGSAGIELEDVSDIRSLLNYQTAVGQWDLVIVTQAAFDTIGPEDDLAAPASGTAVAISIEAVVVGTGNLPNLDDLRDALTSAGWAAGAAPGFEGPSAGGLIALRES